MSVMLRRVFISYRREDTSGYAGRIYDRLQRQFPRQIFMDVSSIDAGVDFAESIEREIETSSVVVALIGKHWLDVERLSDPEDFVIREIGLALHKKIPVIPVLLRGARMPSATELPSSLKLLTRKTAVEVGETTFDRDIEVLIRALKPKLGKTVANRISIAVVLALGVLVVVLQERCPSLGSLGNSSAPISPSPGQNDNSSPSSSPLLFEPGGKWLVTSNGEFPRSMLLNLKQDHGYDASECEGVFQAVVVTSLGIKGTWSFYRPDSKLILIGKSSGLGLVIRITQRQSNSFLGVDKNNSPYKFTLVSR